MPLYEFCAENITLLEKAFQAGARRVELCDNLAVGGTTPSNAVIKEAVRLAKEYQAKVIVMIRPRGGDFVYSDQELDIMLEDWKVARDLGVDGLAVGVLTADNQLDKDAMLCFIQASQGYELTMHMAFELAANKAHVCFIGTPHENLTFTPAQWENMNRKEFKLTGSWMSYSAPFPGREWDLTAHYFASGQLKFDPGFIYKKIPMSQAQEAFQLFKTPGLVKGKILLSNEEE